MNKILAVALVVISIGLSAEAQQGLGRGALTTESAPGAGTGRAALPASQHDGFLPGDAWGVKVDLGWADAKWDVGPVSGSETLFAPQVSLFYMTTDNLDVNFSALFLSAKDTDSQFGNNKADLTRLALGLRYWVRTQTRVTPYFGGGIGYYLLDGKTDETRDDNGNIVPANVSGIKDMPGAFLEGGAAFQVGDDMFINAGITYDFLLGSGDVTINNKTDSFDVKALSVNLGVTWTL